MNLSLCDTCYRVECDKIGVDEVEVYCIKPLSPCDGCGGEGFRLVRASAFDRARALEEGKAS